MSPDQSQPRRCAAEPAGGGHALPSKDAPPSEWFAAPHRQRSAGRCAFRRERGSARRPGDPADRRRRLPGADGAGSGSAQAVSLSWLPAGHPGRNRAPGRLAGGRPVLGRDGSRQPAALAHTVLAAAGGSGWAGFAVSVGRVFQIREDSPAVPMSLTTSSEATRACLPNTGRLARCAEWRFTTSSEATRARVAGFVDNCCWSAPAPAGTSTAPSGTRNLAIPVDDGSIGGGGPSVGSRPTPRFR